MSFTDFEYCEETSEFRFAGKMMDAKTLDRVWRIQWGIPERVNAHLMVKASMVFASFSKVPVGIAQLTTTNLGKMQWSPEGDDRLLATEKPNCYCSEWVHQVITNSKDEAEDEDVETIAEVSNDTACDPNNDMD